MNIAPLDDRQVMSLWTTHAPRVFAYIFSLEPNWANAEDILQETGMTVWEKREDFRPGSDFRAWACRIAYFKVLSFARRGRALDTVGEQLLETLTAEGDHVAAALEPQLAALSECLEKLSPRNREILNLRYSGEGTARQVAEKLGYSLIGAYKALQRIHESLFACIERATAREAR